MDAFTLGLTVLAVCSIIFYIVLFSFIFYWHLVKISFVIVPMIFAFEFFAMGFFIVAIVTFVVQFLPELIRLSGI